MTVLLVDVVELDELDSVMLAYLAARLVDFLAELRVQKKYPNAKIYSLLNSELREEINESSREVCKHYGVQLIELYDIEKQNGHPSIKGMQSICDQLIEAIK